MRRSTITTLSMQQLEALSTIASMPEHKALLALGKEVINKYKARLIDFSLENEGETALAYKLKELHGAQQFFQIFSNELLNTKNVSER